MKRDIKYNKLYLLHKLLKIKKKSKDDPRQRHNLAMQCKLINEILNQGIDYVIDKTKGKNKFKEVE